VIARIIADGVLSGAVLAIAALGLSLTYAVFRFPNFAHAEYLTAGAYGALVGFGAALAAGGQSTAVLVAAAVASAFALAVAFVTARLFAPLIAGGRGPALVIASFAAGLLVRNLIVLTFGPTEQHIDRDLEIAAPIAWGVRATPSEIAIVIAVAALVLGFHLLLRHTPFGRSLRAVAENPELAAVTGVAVGRVQILAWTLTGFACAAAGLALVLLAPVRPDTGYDFLLPALAAVVLGGLGSIYGTLAGAMILGLAEAAAVHAGIAEWRQAISFIVIILILLIRPRGILGRSS